MDHDEIRAYDQEVRDKHMDSALCNFSPYEEEMATKAMIHLERYMRLLDRVTEERAWQDFSTAPKDGTKILVFDSYVKITYYHIPHLYPEAAHWFNDLWDPTHWMPLPQPPTTKGD
jgi:hypothetical protein